MAHQDVLTCRDGRTYQILRPVGKTASCSLYSARSAQGSNPAVVKVLDQEGMLPERLSVFRKEYELLQALDIPGLAKPTELVEEPRRVMMVFDNVTGEPLENSLDHLKTDLSGCLRVALQLSRVLAGLHDARIFHGDIRPSNILIDASKKVCLIDLSRAAQRAVQVASHEPAVADWAYVSPEQTGRTSRQPDHRADLYALGILLYRMITGQLPFHGKDALEWVHCHIARSPLPPDELSEDIPLAVSAVVMRLLEKMPEDRYQSAYGLRHDLEACLAQWEARGAIAPFVPGIQDLPGRLQIPQKLVGRDAERHRLLDSLDAVIATGRPSLTLVSGPPGVGKSAVVHDLRGPVVERGGYFVSGKFDQYQRDIPYATVTQAFSELVRQILAESEAHIAERARQIREAVGANGQLIVDVFPQMELIIGPQPPMPELPAAEAQNRFRLVFEKFIGVFAQEAHPLTLFLDDLQWTDAASLRLVRELVATADKRYLFVICAYRDSEVGPSHPLASFRNEMAGEGIAVTEIELGPLSEKSLSVFIDTMLQCDACTPEPVVRLIYEKTGGNPFFVIQFISALAEEGLITFDPAAKVWRWDTNGISGKGYTDNVAELMIGRLERLSASVRGVLQRLACLGSSAPTSLLTRLCGQSEADTRAALSTAVRVGLILHTADSISFLHDWVREASYLSIPETSRAALHLQIGRQLMAGKTQAQIEEDIFAIVNQFNGGSDCITSANDKALLCRLNFLAGKKAKAAVAYHSACSYLDRARSFLPDNAWQTQYQHAFELTLALSECKYLIGHHEHAEQLACMILSKAQSSRDRAAVCRLRLQLYQTVGRFDAAVDAMFDGVREFGVIIPATDAEIEAAIRAEVRDISVCLQGRRIADVVDAPQLADADMESLIALLAEGLPPTYVSRTKYFALVCALATKLSLRHGNTVDSCLPYSCYGMVLLAHDGDITSALEFSEMALRLTRKLNGRRVAGRVMVSHLISLSPLNTPLSSSMPLLEQSYATCLEVGDLLYANYGTLVYFWLMLQQGATLDTITQSMRRHFAIARQSRNESVDRLLRFQQQFVVSMKGQTRGPGLMEDDDFDEKAYFSALEAENFAYGIESSCILKLMSAFIYGDYDTALAAAEKALQKLTNAGTLMLVDSALHFYFALTLAARYPTTPAAEQRKLAGMLAEEVERFASWAGHSPENFRSGHALLAAELACIEGRYSEAEQQYELAIRSARESGFIQNEAIAFERASALYRSRGLGVAADAFLGQARTCFLRWGADGKVAQLDARYPQLRSGHPAPGFVDDCAGLPLDVLSVVKASQAISSRIVLSELADTLLRIIVESAGAQTGYLLLSGGDGIQLAADAHVEQGEVHVRSHQPRTQVPLPTSILNYVQRSREQVLLPDVAHPNPFSIDSYFSDHHPRSVLCMPILRQDTLIGLLYLENNLITHAFAQDRVAVLKLLASQAAISLENARLYADLLQENSERERAEDALRKEEARMRRLVDANIIGVIFADLGGSINEANDAFLQLSGYSRADLRSGVLHWPAMTPPEFRAADEAALEQLKRTGICAPYEKEIIRKDGSRTPVLVGSALIEGAQGQGVSFVLDLSARKQAEEQIRHMAHHDALTGLPNRVLMQDRIDQAIAYAHRNQSHVAILFIDLDYFKNINDSLGHHIGDALLQMTAGRLQECLREGDSLARLGGDEFVLCLPMLNDSGDAAVVAQKALDVLSQPFAVEGHELHVSASIGISLYPGDGVDVKTLMRTADTAMYHAKGRGRANFQFFTETLNRAVQRRLDVGTRLRHALANDELVVYYQPQVRLENGAIFSAEALLRWRQRGGQPISFGSFIENAEETGLIVPIGEWTLRQSCRQLKAWRDAGHPELNIAVNLSVRQLQEPGFCSLVESILKETGIPATALELEITESTLLPHDERTLAILAQLSEMGIELSIDDFGTGYSSLAYLQRFPVHALKIDQSFVHNIGRDRNATALVAAIISMATSLDRKIIAEGVETLEQAQFLRTHGCLAAQGFYYGKAMPADALLELLNSTSA